MKEKWNKKQKGKRVKKNYPRNKCSKQNIKFFPSSHSYILILSVVFFPPLWQQDHNCCNLKKGGVECFVISFNCELVHLWVLQWITLMSKMLKFSKMCNKYQYGAQENDLSFSVLYFFITMSHSAAFHGLLKLLAP